MVPYVCFGMRWEHDKSPEMFFEAVRLLKLQGADFRLNVLGQSFGRAPEVFGWARDYFSDRIDHWGHIDSRADYAAALANADVVVSTAQHEFFGIGVVEALAAGAYPLLPARLAYPEILHQVWRVPNSICTMAAASNWRQDCASWPRTSHAVAGARNRRRFSKRPARCSVGSSVAWQWTNHLRRWCDVRTAMRKFA